MKIQKIFKRLTGFRLTPPQKQDEEKLLWQNKSFTKNADSIPYSLSKMFTKTKLLQSVYFHKINPVRFISNSKIFDADWYLDTNKDVKSSGLDPAYHFYTRGWMEGRSPSIFFNMKDYLSKFHPTKCPLLYTDEKYKPQEVFFSVIVASYNYEKELETCLKSLVNQQYNKFEIIVVDDGSTDSSVQIIKKFQAKYPFIIFFSHKNNVNKGLPSTIDLALSKSRGQYIAFCECDDFWSKNHLSEVNKEIQKCIANNCQPGIIVNDVSLFGEEKRCDEMREPVALRKKKILELEGNIAADDFKTLNFIVTFSACCVLRDALKTCNILDVPKKTALDWWLWRQLAGNYKINYIDKKLTFWRLHQSYNIKEAASEDRYNYLFEKKLNELLEIQNKNLCFTRKYPSDFKWSDNIRTRESSRNIIDKLTAGNFYKIKILYVTTTSQTSSPIRDGSSRYRAFHMAETLRSYSAFVSVTTNSAFSQCPSFDYDIYIFHRPCFSLIEEIEQLKKLGKILVADYDDLIFGGEEFAQASSGVINGKFTIDRAVQYYKQNLEVLSLFKNVTVSTKPLLNVVRGFFPIANVNCINNFIPQSILNISYQQKLFEEKKDNNLILYCSGTASHNADFKLIEEVVLESLTKNKDLKFAIIGVLSTSRAFKHHPRIFFRPPVDYPNLFKLMSSAAHTIAPLEDTFFNSCKSNVKFLESALSGSKLIATPIPDMERVADASILLPKNVNEWRDILMGIPESRINHNPLGNFQYLATNCSGSTFCSQFINAFENYSYE